MRKYTETHYVSAISVYLILNMAAECGSKNLLKYIEYMCEQEESATNLGYHLGLQKNSRTGGGGSLRKF